MDVQSVCMVCRPHKMTWIATERYIMMSVIDAQVSLKTESQHRGEVRMCCYLCNAGCCVTLESNRTVV